MIPELRTLLEMLTYCRPDGSQTEQEFIAKWILPLGALRDVNKNYHVTISQPNGSPSRVVWSCHTDTVAYAGGRQTVHYSPATGIVELSRKSKLNRNCLGADDTAGVWLCMNMIQAQVPGHYIFHYGEEVGGIGSSGLAYSDVSQLDDIDCAIALDRRSNGDIITHQFGGRCASEAFADSLALELFRCSDERLIYNSAHGTYTDTAEYTGLVRECTNLSIGYADEHRPSESLDTEHIMRLLAALKLFDETALVIEREVDAVYEPAWAQIWGDYDRDVDSPPLEDSPEERIANACCLNRVYADVQYALKRRNCPTCGRDMFVGFEHTCVFVTPIYPRMVC